MHFTKTLVLAAAALALLCTNSPPGSSAWDGYCWSSKRSSIHLIIITIILCTNAAVTAAPIHVDETSCVCASLASDTSFSTNATAPWLNSSNCEAEAVDEWRTCAHLIRAATAACNYFIDHWACSFL